MRLFDEHIKRRTRLLDGMWDFATDEKEVGLKEEWFKNFPEKSMQVNVPGCINNRLGFIEFQKTCWYKKDFYAEGHISIKFESVSEYARIYLDGEFLGDHYGSFSAFEVKAFVACGKHTLVVMVDSRSTEDTIPLWGVDWHHYCGIMRSVELAEYKTTAIESMRFEYDLDVAAKRVKYNAVVKISATESPVKTNCRIDIDGQIIFDEEIEIDGEKEFCVKGELSDVRLWDVGAPQLYTVTVQTEDDDLIDRVGFRKIEIDGKKILLNNKRVKFLGINRHEEHPEWGFAVAPALVVKDMDILKDMNVNTVRGSHYPNSKLFVDLCDANGIMFWSEIPMWGFPKEALARPLVLERGLMMHTEMVEQYYNHPSIIIWGMHNEVATDSEEGYELTKKFVKHSKALDSSRLVTYATNRPLEDNCYDLVDFISVNRYIGWYDSEIEDWADFVVDMKKYFESKGVGDKPVVMSEFGVAAIFGQKNFECLRWSEDYQAKFFEHTLDLFLKDEDLSGVYLWQLCDIRSSAVWQLNRARSFNNKGLLNEYRQPKLAYYKVKEIFANEGNN